MAGIDTPAVPTGLGVNAGPQGVTPFTMHAVCPMTNGCLLSRKTVPFPHVPELEIRWGKNVGLVEKMTPLAPVFSVVPFESEVITVNPKK